MSDRWRALLLHMHFQNAIPGYTYTSRLALALAIYYIRIQTSINVHYTRDILHQDSRFPDQQELQSCQPKNKSKHRQWCSSFLHEVSLHSLVMLVQSQQSYVLPPATSWIPSSILSSVLVQAPSSVLVLLKSIQLVHRSCWLVFVALCARPRFFEHAQAGLSTCQIQNVSSRWCSMQLVNKL